MAYLNPGVAVWLWVAVLAAFATVMSQTTLIPSIPASQEDSPLANLWRHALRNQKSPSGQVLRSDEPAPKTHVAPDHGEVMNWVPQDSRHPLYVPENADLLREILLDSMVQEVVKPDDPRMSQSNGLQVTNLFGKTITFTRDASGIKVNEVPVTDSKTNEDGTVSYILEESIFNHRQKVHDAWKKLPKTASGFGPFGGPPMNAPAPPPPTA